MTKWGSRNWKTKIIDFYNLVIEYYKLLLAGNESNNTHNLHIVEYGDKNWQNQILFRDFINDHSDYREKYCSLKMELAKKYKDDRATYTKEKTEFILDVIQLAKQELKKD